MFDFPRIAEFSQAVYNPEFATKLTLKFAVGQARRFFERGRRMRGEFRQ
jgi:hypothetical protein